MRLEPYPLGGSLCQPSQVQSESFDQDVLELGVMNLGHYSKRQALNLVRHES